MDELVVSIVGFQAQATYPVDQLVLLVESGGADWCQYLQVCVDFSVQPKSTTGESKNFSCIHPETCLFDVKCLPLIYIYMYIRLVRLATHFPDMFLCSIKIIKQFVSLALKESWSSHKTPAPSKTSFVFHRDDSSYSFTPRLSSDAPKSPGLGKNDMGWKKF